MLAARGRDERRARRARGEGRVRHGLEAEPDRARRPAQPHRALAHPRDALQARADVHPRRGRRRARPLAHAEHRHDAAHALRQLQFVVVSLKEGMFNNANVIFRTSARRGRLDRQPHETSPPRAAAARARPPRTTTATRTTARCPTRAARSVEEAEARARRRARRRRGMITKSPEATSERAPGSGPRCRRGGVCAYGVTGGSFFFALRDLCAELSLLSATHEYS